MDSIHFPLTGNSVIMAIVILIHVFFAFFAVGGAALSTAAEWWGARKKDDDYLRLARSVSGFLSDMMKVNGVLGVAIVVLTIGLWSQFAAFLYSTQFWPFLAEGGVFLLLMIGSITYHNTWDSASRRVHIFYGVCTAFFALLAGLLINGIWAFMLVPGDWMQTQSRWDAFFTPILVESTLHILLPCLINAALLVFLWTYWKSGRTQGAEQQYYSKMNLFTGRIGAVLLFLQPVSGISFLHKVWSATAELPAPNPWSQLWTGAHGSAPMAKPFLIIMITLAVIAMACAVLYWALGHEKGRRALAAASLAMFLAFFIGGFTRERARKPYLVWNTMYMNQHFVNKAPAPPPAAGTAASGKQALKNSGCMACHAGGAGTPALTGLAQKYDKTKLMEFIRRPPAVMPPFTGSDQELEALAEYLLNK